MRLLKKIWIGMMKRFSLCLCLRHPPIQVLSLHSQVSAGMPTHTHCVCSLVGHLEGLCFDASAEPSKTSANTLVSRTIVENSRLAEPKCIRGQ